MSTTTINPVRTTPTPALANRRLRELLGLDPDRTAVRIRCEQGLVFGEEWVWRNGDLHTTARGLRTIAEAFAQRGDDDAAALCHREAHRLDEEAARDRAAAAGTPSPGTTPTVEAYQRTLEARHLA